MTQLVNKYKTCFIFTTEKYINLPTNVQYLAMFGCPVTIGWAVDICWARVLSEFKNQFRVQSDGVDFHLNDEILWQENSNINKLLGRRRDFLVPRLTFVFSIQSPISPLYSKLEERMRKRLLLCRVKVSHLVTFIPRSVAIKASRNISTPIRMG